MRRIPAGRLLRRLAIIVGGLLVTLAVLAALAPALVRGARFAWLVGKLLPPMRGHVSLGGGHVDGGAVLALLVGRPFSVVLDDLRVLDPEGTVVLASAHLSARIELHRSPGRMIVHDLRPGTATWRLGRMQRHRGIGFVAAFVPSGRARARAGPAPPPSPSPLVFQIASADLDGLDATFDFPSWGLELHNVKAAGSLLADLRDADHHVFGIDVHDIDARGGGGLRILDGAQAARLPFQSARIERVAITPERQNDLQLVVTAADTGRSRLHGQATFGGVVGIDPAAPPGLDIQATLAAPAEALAALGVGTRVGPVGVVGAGGEIDLGLRGPYQELSAVLRARDIDLAYGGLGVGRAQLQATASLAPLRAAIDRLEVTAPGGGRVEVQGSLDRALDLTGAVRFRHVATEGFLPPSLRAAGAGVLDGEIDARGGLASGTLALSRLDLTWQRPAGAPAPRVIRLRGRLPPPGAPAQPGLTVRAPGLAFADGLLTLRHLALPALGGRISVDGEVRFWRGGPAQLLPSPLLAVDVRADDIDLDRAGLAPLIGGRLAVAARVHGSLNELAARAQIAPSSRLTILGAPYAPAGPVELRADNDDLILSALPLVEVSSGAQATGQSRVDLRGRIGWRRGDVDVRLAVADRDLFGLPGLREAALPMQGRLDAQLRLQGRLAEPSLSGEATLREVSLAGRPVGGGTLTLQADGRRRSHVHGVLFDAFTIDGAIADRADVPLLDLTVSLDGAALDPLLPAFPPLLSDGRASASGQVSMQVSAGHPVRFDARFSQLALSYRLRSPASSRRPAARVGIHSVGPVAAHMTGWGSELTLEESAFDFGAGGLHVAGTVRGGALAAHAHGPIDLARLAPVFEAVAPGEIDGVSGLAEAEVRVGGTVAAPRLRGRLGVARPVEVGLRALPGARFRLETGTFHFEDAGSARLESATATLRYRDAASFTTGAATLVLDGRATGVGQPGGPTISGQATIRSAELTSLALGDTVRVRETRVTAAGNVLTVPALEASSDHHGRFSVGGSGQGPATIAFATLDPLRLGAVDVVIQGADAAYGPVSGLKIDDMDFRLRLSGDLSRAVTLAGEVALRAGRFQTDARPSSPGAAPAPANPSRGRPRAPTLRDRVALDVRLRSDGERFLIAHRFVPALRLRLDLHAGGTLASPKISGQAGATDVLSWLALLLVRPFR
ncbi:MAG TPA: hypothetical protein VMU50_02220 [Polyangia bacterium]|nr:hypothetical protein [Polyangia bacterium]